MYIVQTPGGQVITTHNQTGDELSSQNVSDLIFKLAGGGLNSKQVAKAMSLRHTLEQKGKVEIKQWKIEKKPLPEHEVPH